MKNRLLIHLISLTVGTISIYLIMKLESEFLGIKNQLTEKEFSELEHFAISNLFIIGLFFVFVSLIQFLIILPTFNLFSQKNKLTTQKVIIIGIVLTIVFGTFFGLFFTSKELGVVDLLESIGFGLLVFAIFYTTNFFTFIKLSSDSQKSRIN
ncbi:MAG: hypothetical protein PSN34_06970 [Urechidicola sp.]|nr:hypothetical protein [Urechidicola sp.]